MGAVREDYLESLDKMFPNGYIILHIPTDGEIPMSLFNPNKNESLEEWRRLLDRHKETRL